MKKIIFATGNANKMVEVRMILADCGYEIVSMKEAGIDIDIVEDGKTFEENAIIKATAISKTKEAEGCVVLADDSGLEVDYMDGAPGIYSARFANIEIHGDECVDNEKNADDEDNNNLLLEKLQGVAESDRTAYYVCAISCIFPDGKEISVRGECHGIIGFERDGNAGFGYDPLFIINGKSFGKYEGEEKDKISHRGKALRSLAEELKKII